MSADTTDVVRIQAKIVERPHTQTPSRGKLLILGVCQYVWDHRHAVLTDLLLRARVQQLRDAEYHHVDGEVIQEYVVHGVEDLF